MRWLAFALSLLWALVAAAEPPPPLDETDPGLRVPPFGTPARLRAPQ